MEHFVRSIDRCIATVWLVLGSCVLEVAAGSCGMEQTFQLAPSPSSYIVQKFELSMWLTLSLFIPSSSLHRHLHWLCPNEEIDNPRSQSDIFAKPKCISLSESCQERSRAERPLLSKYLKILKACVFKEFIFSSW